MVSGTLSARRAALLERLRGLDKAARSRNRTFMCVRWIGVRFAQSIRASGHIRRISRPDTWPHPTQAAKPSKKALARAPSTRDPEQIQRQPDELTRINGGPLRLNAALE